MIDRLRIPKRAWTFIHLSLILCVGWIMAGLVDQVIVGAVTASFPAPETGGPVGAGQEKLDAKPDYSQIIRLNIFNSAQAASFEGEQELPIVLVDAGSIEKAPKTTLDLKLIGTVLDTQGLYRLAAIEIKSSGDQILYRMHDSVSGATIVSIERNRVGLMRGDRLESLEVDFTGAASSKGRGKRGKTGSALKGKAVMKVGEGDYTVDKRYVDAQLGNMNRLLTQVRAVPNMDKNGVTNGFKLFSIRKGSLFDKIGLKNHDVVQKINGVELNSAEKGLELFQVFRNEASFEVDLLRKSQKTTLRFNIQ